MRPKLRVRGGQSETQGGRERRQPCEETDKKSKKEVDAGLKTGPGSSTRHHASLVLSVGLFISTSHT